MKRTINKEDIRFLKDLQREMNTQDHVCQADPRFWVIAGSKKVYGVDDGYEDGFELYDQQNCETVADGFKESVYYLEKEILPEINKEQRSEYDTYYELETNDDATEIYCKLFETDSNELFVTECYNFVEFVEWINEQTNREFSLANYRYERDSVYPNTFFITHREAKRHLERQKHNYCSDAHTYAMTALLSPEVEQLWKFLQVVDFEKLESLTNDRFYLVDRYHDDNITNQTSFDISEAVEYLKTLKENEENHVEKAIYLPLRISHGLIAASTIDFTNWQLWANHYSYDVKMFEDEVNYWYTEKWSDDDITACLEELGIECSEQNIARARHAVRGIFEDKTDRNELLSQWIENEFERDGECHG